jgi:hypothetical protein
MNGVISSVPLITYNAKYFFKAGIGNLRPAGRCLPGAISCAKEGVAIQGVWEMRKIFGFKKYGVTERREKYIELQKLLVL